MKKVQKFIISTILLFAIFINSTSVALAQEASASATPTITPTDPSPTEIIQSISPTLSPSPSLATVSPDQILPTEQLSNSARLKKSISVRKLSKDFLQPNESIVIEVDNTQDTTFTYK